MDRLHETLYLLQRWGEALLTPSAVTLAAATCIIVGILYVVCALHEVPRVPRLTEIILGILSLGAALGVILGFCLGGGPVAALCGFCFGCGLGLGIEFPLPGNALDHTWFGRVQAVYRGLAGWVVGLAIGLPAYCISSIVVGVVALVFFVVVFLLAGIPFGIGFTVFEVGWWFVKWLRHLLFRVDSAAEKVIGSSERSAGGVILGRFIPHPVILGWMLAAAASLYIYFVGVFLGHVVAYIGKPLFPTALGTQSQLVHLFLFLPGFGLAVGTVFLMLSLISWFYSPHGKKDEAWKLAQSELLDPYATEVQALADDDKRLGALSNIGAMLPETFRPGPDAPATEQQHVFRQTLLRSVVFLPLCGFLIGVADELGFLPIDHFATAAAPAYVQHGVVLGCVFLLNQIASRVNTLALGMLGTAILLAGIVLQVLQHPNALAFF